MDQKKVQKCITELVVARAPMFVENSWSSIEEVDVMQDEADAAEVLCNGSKGVEDDDDEVPPRSIKEHLRAIATLRCVKYAEDVLDICFFSLYVPHTCHYDCNGVQLLGKLLQATFSLND